MPTSLVRLPCTYRIRPRLRAPGSATMHMHEHVHIFGVPCLPEPTYLVPLFPRRRLLCYLVMVYITIDDLVLDHLSGHQSKAARLRMLPLARLAAMSSATPGPTPTSEGPSRFDVITCQC
jgi:hypothetical protein